MTIENLINKLKANGIYDEFLAYDKDYKNLAEKEDCYSFPFILLRTYLQGVLDNPATKEYQIIYDLLTKDKAYEWFMKRYDANKKWLYDDWNKMRNRKGLPSQLCKQ